MDAAQNLQGLSYEVCSTPIATIFRTQIIHYSFWDMCYHTPIVCCCVTKIYEIGLYVRGFCRLFKMFYTKETYVPFCFSCLYGWEFMQVILKRSWLSKVLR